MTFDDGSIFDYEVTNGSNSAGGASTWDKVNDKPFETIGSDFTVVDNELKLADGVGGKIDTVKVNGVESGEVIVVADDSPVSGLTNGTYLKLVIANQTEPVYINVADLCDVYTGKAATDGVSVAISASNEISATLIGKAVAEANLEDTLAKKINDADTSLTWGSII